MANQLKNKLIVILLLFICSCSVKNECEDDIKYYKEGGLDMMKFKKLNYTFRKYHQNGKVQIQAKAQCCDSVLCVTYYGFNENGDTLFSSQKRGYKFYGVQKSYENNQLTSIDSAENGIYTYRQLYKNGMIDSFNHEFLFYPLVNETNFLLNDTFYVNLSESKLINLRIGRSLYENNIELEVSFIEGDSIFYEKTNNEDFKLIVDFKDFPKGNYNARFRFYEKSKDTSIKYFYGYNKIYTVMN